MRTSCKHVHVCRAPLPGFTLILIVVPLWNFFSIPKDDSGIDRVHRELRVEYVTC